VNFADGQAVKQGDLLFKIDPRTYEAAKDKAQGDLERLTALEKEANLDLERTEKLRPSGAASQEEYEQREAQLAVYQASLKSAKAALAQAELDLEFTEIRSPIDGRVSRTRVTEGNLIQTSTNDSTVLTTVVTTDPIYVYFDMDEHALLKYEAIAWGSAGDVHPDAIEKLKIPVEIGLANEEGFPHAGVLDFVDNRLDQQTGTIRARGVFDNSTQYLTPGLYVRVRVPIGNPHEALMVSERAIGRDQDRKFLLTVNKDNVVEYHQVELGALRDGLRVIESGLQPSDWVVVNGLQRARPGKPVTPHAAEEGVAESVASVSGPASAPVGASGQTGAGQVAN
jgi:RND family efflux transporter MFP subunit